MIVIDLDATDLPVHGHQEQRFFHGFYNHYCYLPLYIVCGDHLLGVRLRPSNIDASADSLEEIERIVQQIRQSWPQVKITHSRRKEAWEIAVRSARAASWLSTLPAITAPGADATASPG